MQRWYVLHGRDGYAVTLVREPFYRQPIEYTVGTVDAWLGHIVCEPPGWAFRIPWGRATRDDEGYWVDSVGQRWWQVGERILNPFAHRTQRLTRIPVTVEVARALDPELVASIDDLHRDTDSSPERVLNRQEVC